MSFLNHSLPSPLPPDSLGCVQVFGLQKNIFWPVRGGEAVFPLFYQVGCGAWGTLDDCIVPGGSKQALEVYMWRIED